MSEKRMNLWVQRLVLKNLRAYHAHLLIYYPGLKILNKRKKRRKTKEHGNEN